MNKIITLILALFALTGPIAAQSFLQMGLAIDGEAAEDEAGTSVCMPDGNTIAIGAYLNDGSSLNAGHVRIYSWNGSEWLQKGEDIDGEAEQDRLGWSLDMPDNNTIAIGAYLNDGSEINTGHVRIYNWNGSAWIQKGADIDGEAADDRSGWSVSMPDANTVAIGAYQNGGNGNDAGHVRIYVWNEVAWIQKGGDIDGEVAEDLSGHAVSMPDANTVAIGAHRNDGGTYHAGHVRIYFWDGLNWVQKGADIDGEAADDYSGYAVDMPDANTVATGAWGNDGNASNAGHVRVYTWDGVTWVQKGIDIDGAAANDEFGYSISMPDNNTIAVGAYRADGTGLDAGQVRIYKWDGSTWTQPFSSIDGEMVGDQSGYSVSMPNPTTIAIGARYNSNTGFNAGQTRIYSSADEVGVLETNFSYTILVYPNPCNGALHIDLGERYTNLTVAITNIWGQQVLLTKHNDTHYLKLNIPGPAGIYFIELRSGDKKAIVKIIKE